MRKLSISLLLLISILFLYSCNEKKNDTEEEKPAPVSEVTAEHNFDFLEEFPDGYCANAGGMANFIITKSLADSMTNNFDSIYKKDASKNDIKAMQNKYWLDTCTILAISKFLKDSVDSFDGIRISMGASTINDNGYGASNPFKNKTTLIIYPTKKSDSGHVDVNIPILSKACNQQSEYIKEFPKASSEMNVFIKKYYGKVKPNDITYTLSKGFWIDACVVHFIAAIIRDKSQEIDGINIKAAAYFGNEGVKVPGKIAKKQSTVVLVPSTGPNHDDNWEVIEKMFSNKRFFALFGGALNHSQLCPQLCD